MLRKSLMTFAVAAVFAVSAFGQTADELIEKNIQARGGLEKMKAVKSLRLTGKIVVGPGIEAPFVRETSRPNNVRLEFTIQGMTAVQTFDGTNAWALMPFLGKKEPEAMTADELKDVEDQADIDGPLIDYKAKGHTVELIGKEDIEGTPAFKLKVSKKNGDIDYTYLDAESFLEIKGQSKRSIRGQEVEVETSFGDYKEVDGVLFAYSIQQKAKGTQAGGNMAITIDKIETNPTLAADRFGKPASLAAPAAPQSK
jgi:outer membrane lipoprotein-sorting protein